MAARYFIYFFLSLVIIGSVLFLPRFLSSSFFIGTFKKGRLGSKKALFFKGLVIVAGLSILIVEVSINHTVPTAKADGETTNQKDSMQNMPGMTNTSQMATSSTASTPPATNYNLNKGEIKAENQAAVDIMNEKALKPTLLPDGTKKFTLKASTFGWALYPGKTMEGWGFNKTVPGPLIRVKVGDKVEIDVSNQLTEPMTVHWHGFQVPNDMDGVPGMPTPAIKPNGTFKYKFTVTNQMIGTHWYHSHYDDDFQVDAGMYGAIIVGPKEDSSKNYDVDKLFELGSTKVDGSDPENVFMINGRSYPYTPQMTLKKGQRVLLRLVNASSENYHSVSLDGYSLKIVAEDGAPLPVKQTVNVVSIAPSETMDVMFTANRTGDWWFHSTIGSEMENPDDTQDQLGGMMTLIHVK
ncbi:multicopper oxidase domain-containing protein [Pullulanibacillus sp. KACC 23026]|uniref:multicopper oxidase family protein n=1 Tax=Pullulanibacillus sp. KACC 23026 TaxID=3028315 RepID=UPI0023AF41B8|nr:multicopper oxidase domain-containing protein [Pullulanibacillus sp. KACC 23026]WEG12636.1 multicopper oxidase domain-containing protein [Pullulanibacillus sp. KACC 23026]